MALDPTVGSEIRKTRPCVVLSPNELTTVLRTILVAPMTTKGQPYSWRPSCEFAGKRGTVVLDQLRAVDTSRLGRRLGILDPTTSAAILTQFRAFFAP